MGVLSLSDISIAIVGRGRLGSALAVALRERGYRVAGPFGRADAIAPATLTLLAVPERELVAAAYRVSPDGIVGHCSASAPLELLAPRERLNLHPLMTLNAAVRTTVDVFAGAACAVDGSTDNALLIAQSLGTALGMRPIRVQAQHRALYHAAASMAANYLVTLLYCAQQLGELAGLARSDLAPLARAALNAVVSADFNAAISGPVSRGDADTVAAQRAAVHKARPNLTALFDALTEATRDALAATGASHRPSTVERSPQAAHTRVHHSSAALRTALLAARDAGQRIGFVPTMGALHDGHLALARQAVAECDVVVCSIFVNPIQFNNADDLQAYPRTLKQDVALLTAVGVREIFVPESTEMYPEGAHTTIDVGRIAEPLEGASRGTGHFRGVATVVAKLFNLVQPHSAYFGQKDAQQLLVIRQLVRDLDIPVRIVGCPTIREADGLAMSSRNARLSASARMQAPGISRALFAMQAHWCAGVQNVSKLISVGEDILVKHGIASIAIDYLAVVNAQTLESCATASASSMIAIAAHVDGVRLIDNLLLQAEST